MRIFWLMTMTSKICNNCGKEVDGNVNFCPHCKSQSFRVKNEIIKSDNNLIHKLFYWKHDGYYVFSLSKFSALLIFIAFLLGVLSVYSLGPMILLGAIFGLFDVFLGYIYQYKILNPSKAQLENNNFGFLQDMIHALLFWQDKMGKFVFSKTKSISLLIFVFIAIWCFSDTGQVPVAVLAASFFGVPAFIMGFLIHKYLENHKPKQIKTEEKPKEVERQKSIAIDKEKPVTDQRLLKYKSEIEALQIEYTAKDEVARQLIEKRFEPPQLTYNKFISSVDNALKLFEREAKSALYIINLSSEFTPRIEGELESKIHVMKTIISKMDDLTNELVLSLDDSKEDDVHGLVQEMDELIESVNDYN